MVNSIVSKKDQKKRGAGRRPPGWHDGLQEEQGRKDWQGPGYEC